MRNFDLSFPERRTFIFSDVGLAQCSPCESYSSNWFQYSLALPRSRCRIWRLSVLWYSTQLSLATGFPVQYSYCAFTFILLRLFCLVVLQVRKWHSAPNWLPFSFKRTDIRENANTHKAIWCKYLSRSIYTAVDWISQTGFCFWQFLFLDTLLPRVFEDCGSEGGPAFGVGFAWSLLSCRKLHWSPLEHWPLLLSIDSKLLVLFQHHLTPCDSWPLHLFRFSHVWRQNFAVEVSDLYSLSPWFSTFRVVAFSSFWDCCSFSVIYLDVHQACNAESSLTARFIFFLKNWHSGGCQYSQGVRVQVPLKKYLHGCRRMDPWLLVPRTLLFLDTLRPRDTVASEGVAAVCSGFCARLHVSGGKRLSQLGMDRGLGILPGWLGTCENCSL